MTKIANAVRDLILSGFANLFFTILLIALLVGFYHTGKAVFMTVAIIPALMLFAVGENDTRTVLSVVMLASVLALTGLIAFRPATPEASMNWLVSKTMFVAIFGIFGSHLVDQWNWEEEPASSIAIVVGILALFAAYLFKFPIQVAAEPVANAGAALPQVARAAAKVAYDTGDWLEDVLFGVASLLFTAVIPKVVKKKRMWK